MDIALRPSSTRALPGAFIRWDTILGRSLTALLLAADGDDAGRQANARWSAQLVKRGHPHEIITWPEGADTASYLADHELDTCLTITIPGEFGA